LDQVTPIAVGVAARARCLRAKASRADPYGAHRDHRAVGFTRSVRFRFIDHIHANTICRAHRSRSPRAGALRSR